MLSERAMVKLWMTGIVLFMLTASSIWAQRVKSTISGQVTDPSGAAIANATVVLTNEGTGGSARTTTTAEGTFTFPFLDEGKYSLEAGAPGFKTVLRRGIPIQVATDERVDLSLEIGDVGQHIEVIGLAPLLESVSSTLGQTVDNKKVADLPLNGRNIYSLLNIVPGSSLGGPNGAGIQTTDPSINGTRPRGNSFTIDGVAVNQENSGTTGGAGVTYQPALEGVSEFKVVTTNYSAEYGRSMGAVISVSLKSGTNQYHGSAFDYLRNDLLNARNYYASPTAPKPKLRYNQFGGSMGGPIRKNKLFFFSTGEFTRQTGQSVSTQTVPTSLYRQGNFAADSNVIYDPATTQLNSAGVGMRMPFQGNIIPASRIDPAAKAITSFWPDSTSGGLTSNYLSSSSTSSTVNRTDSKIDYSIGAKDTLAGRFSYAYIQSVGAATFPGPANPNATAYQLTKAPGFQVNYTHTFSPRLVSEFRSGYQRQWQQQLGEPSALADWRSKLNLPAIQTDPTLQFGFPYLAVTGEGTLGSPYDRFVFQTDVLQFNETLSWSVGNHMLKFGGSVARVHDVDRIPNFPAGGYYFSGQYTSQPNSASTGRGFADFLLGDAYLAYAGLLVGGGMKPRDTEFGFFIQDDFRIFPKLTLNLGLRYDLVTAIHTDEHTIWTYNPATNSTGLADPPAPSNKRDFAPRVGFAYQVERNTVIRGGYGIAYFPQFKGLGGFFVIPPVLQQHAFTTANPLVPAITFRDTFGTFDTAPTQGISVTPALSVGMFDRNDEKSPYVQSWNMTLEHQFGGNFVVSASYVGNKGTHLENIWNINQLPASLLGPDSQFGSLTAQQRRLYPNAGSVNVYSNNLNSNYNGLQVKADWRYWRGLSFLSAFTYSKAMQEDRSYTQSVWNARASRAVTNADLPRVFVQSISYELPFGAGRKWLNRNAVLAQTLGGWQVNGIFTARDGYPVYVTASSNLSGSFSSIQFANVNGNPKLPADQRSLQHWFNAAAFSIPAAYTFGNAGPFPVRGPGMVNLDFSLFKRFQIAESKRLEFRAEAFNLSNSPGFANPAAMIGSATAGQVTSLLNSNRTLQMALKLLF